MGPFKKYVRSKLPVFDSPPPLVGLCSFCIYLPPQCTFALVSYPRLKKISANKRSMFFTKLYLYKYFIYIILYIFIHKYLHVYKKTFLKKKCLRLFNKKTPLYAWLNSKQKTFSNCQATCQKDLCLLFEIQEIFFNFFCSK